MSNGTMLSIAAVIAGLLAGCTTASWQPPAYETAITRYYEAHASEHNGQCLAPYIDGFTTIQVVEDTPERMVVDARYLYRDWIKDGTDADGLMLGCISYGQRSFVLARSDDGLQVIEMSGPRRN
jgi:hypothetical protein